MINKHCLNLTQRSQSDSGESVSFIEKSDLRLSTVKDYYFMQKVVKALTKCERTKMKRDARQKCCLFYRLKLLGNLIKRGLKQNKLFFLEGAAQGICFLLAARKGGQQRKYSLQCTTGINIFRMNMQLLISMPDIFWEVYATFSIAVFLRIHRRL